MKIIRLLPLLFSLSLMAQESIAVIVNPKSGLESLAQKEVINLFLGRQKRLKDGLTVSPVDLPQSDPTISRFYQLLVKKNVAEISAYWARLYFSGQAQPPRKGESTEDVLNFVANNQGAIGYVETSKVDKRVKVVLTLGEK